MNESDLKSLVREVLQDMVVDAPKGAPAARQSGGALNVEAPDVGAWDMQATLLVENPADKAFYMDMKKHTPARIGVGRAGPRPNYKTLLRFRADHAAAMDAVFNDVPAETIKELGLLEVKTSAPDKAEYLMDPNIGRVFDEENKKIIKEKCKTGAQVQIIVSDGLSSTAVEENIRDLLPALEQGLKSKGLSAGTSLFVQFGRVGIMDAVTELVNSEVTLILLGERPGLVTNESLSCYMTYKGHPGIAESARTVVSNIYKAGTPPAEAGAYIADIAKKMIDSKASGLDLKL